MMNKTDDAESQRAQRLLRKNDQNHSSLPLLLPEPISNPSLPKETLEAISKSHERILLITAQNTLSKPSLADTGSAAAHGTNHDDDDEPIDTLGNDTSGQPIQTMLAKSGF